MAPTYFLSVCAGKTEASCPLLELSDQCYGYDAMCSISTYSHSHSSGFCCCSTLSPTYVIHMRLCISLAKGGMRCAYQCHRHLRGCVTRLARNLGQSPIERQVQRSSASSTAPPRSDLKEECANPQANTELCEPFE